MDLKPRLKDLLKKKVEKISPHPQDPQLSKPQEPQQLESIQNPQQKVKIEDQQEPQTDLKEEKNQEQISEIVSRLQDDGIFRVQVLNKIVEHDALLTELGHALVNQLNTLNKHMDKIVNILIEDADIEEIPKPKLDKDKSTEYIE